MNINKIITISFTCCLMVSLTTSAQTKPYANADHDQTLTDTDGNGLETVILNGTRSTDVDGTILSYDWQENGNSIATGSNPTVALSTGVHTISLVVTDDEGLSHQDDVQINVTTTAFTYEEFISKKFTLIEKLTPSISSPSEDPDKDGTSNLLEYFHARDPGVNEPGSLQFKFDNNNQPAFTYQRMESPQGVTWEWEKSTDLKNWLPIAPSEEQTIDTQSGLANMKTAFNHGSESKMFYRLKVENNNNDPRLFSVNDLEYTGAFRFSGGSGRVDYAVGTLAYNVNNHSLFIAGHSHDNSIAEYPIPTPGMQTTVAELPTTNGQLQAFVPFLNNNPTPLANPDGLNRITGMLVENGSLIVNAEDWYDADANNTNTTFVIEDADNLAGPIDGYFKLGGGAQAAGYMGPIPSNWQIGFGAKHYTGWSNVYSIISRYSQGPSLWSFDAHDLLTGSASVNPDIATQAYMNFPYTYDKSKQLNPHATDWAPQGTFPGPFAPASPLWNQLSRAVYGFFVPGTDTFMAIGSNHGLSTGIGYKAIREDGSVAPGPATYGLNDSYNYYWLFNVNDILAADETYEPRPYDYGILNVPFDKGGKHLIIGATFDPDKRVLYMALKDAGRVSTYDYVPLIVTYKLP